MVADRLSAALASGDLEQLELARQDFVERSLANLYAQPDSRPGKPTEQPAAADDKRLRQEEETVRRAERLTPAPEARRAAGELLRSWFLFDVEFRVSLFAGIL
jgi:hypothetical protein